MSLSNSATTIRRAYKIPILHQSGKLLTVSEVTVVGGSGDDYDTDGVTPVAADCGLKYISKIEVLGVFVTSTTSIRGVQASWPAVGTDAKMKLLVSDADSPDAEMTNGTSLENYTFILKLEGYAP